MSLVSNTKAEVEIYDFLEDTKDSSLNQRSKESDFLESVEGNIRRIVEGVDVQKGTITGRDVSLQSTFIEHQWKLSKVYSARVLQVKEEHVILELVIDKLLQQTQERIFKIDFFSKKPSVGQFYKIQCFRRPDAEMMQAVDGSGVVSALDFPSIDFSEIRSQSLFSKVTQ